MRLQVIETLTNALILEEKDISKVYALPRIGEIITLNASVWEVKGVAHMWDMQIIKIIVENALKS